MPDRTAAASIAKILQRPLVAIALIAVVLLGWLCAAFLGCGGQSSSSAGNTAPTYDFTLKSDWLTMSDGVQLSVTYWMPTAKAAGEKFPVVLEALPYRKDDNFYLRDFPIYAYLAHRGIVGARVDIRGTGSSYGVVPDREYSDLELSDLQNIVAQLATQPWSNGNVGMQGISWSAFNGIMTAMRRPPALKGLLVAHGSQDIYANDIHNIDGGLHIDVFSAEIEISNLIPRSPDYPVDNEYLANRFSQPPWIFTYLHNQRDGDFWEQGRSLQTDYPSIDVPVYSIAALLDGYRDFATAMLDNLKAPIRAEIGPWNHAYPNNGAPGPDYEWRDRAVKWWRQLLNGRDERVLNRPAMLAFVRGSVPADVDLEKTPGSFWSEKWPVENVQSMRLLPQQNGSLATGAGASAQASLSYQASSGAGALNWWGETTPDMRAADKGTLIFDSALLTKEIKILGAPQVVLQVSADAPLADWIVRLEDVNPDGTVSMVTGALRNGSQRLSRTDPQPIVPGQGFQIAFPLHFTTWTFAPGHKIRMVVSNAQFPMIWPTPYAMTTSLAVGDGASSLSLPVVSSSSLPPPHLGPPQPEEERPGGKVLTSVGLTPFSFQTDGQGNASATAYESSTIDINGNELTNLTRVTYKVSDVNPALAQFTGEGDETIKAGNTTIAITSTTTINSDGQFFHTSVVRTIAVNGIQLKSVSFQEDIARDFQ